MFRYIRTRKLIEHASLTPEGFVYLIVLCFITIGSVLRNVNLLILMAGMMYAPLFVNWRLAVRRLRSFEAKRTLPNRIHANKMVNVQWQCENTLDGFSAYNVTIEDRITRAAESEQHYRREQGAEPDTYANLAQRWFGELINRLWRRGNDPSVSIAKLRYPQLVAHQLETQSYRAFFGQRGKYRVGQAVVSTSFPFGLIVSRNYVRQPETFFVAPELGKLDATWEQRVQASAAGSDSVKRSRAMEEDEFYALRPWRSGDSKKNIHWRSTARLGYPIVKQFDQQNNRDFALVLDLFQASPDDIAKIETALSFAATLLLRIAYDVQGRVAISVCGENWHPAKARTANGVIAELMPALAVARGSDLPATVDAIVDVVSSVSSGTPVYVVSSRPRPASLEFMLPSEVEALPGESPEMTIRRGKHLARQLRSALSVVRWLDVESDEFKRIFSMPTATTESENAEASQRPVRGDLKELNAMSQKWVRYE